MTRKIAASPIVLLVLIACGCADHARTAPSPKPKTATTMTPLERISERVNRHGDVNDPATIRPLLTLSEFFDGNDDFGSIGCNLSPPPGPAKFYEMLKSILERSDVADVRVQITMFDDPEAWPFSDTVWIITSANPQTVAGWFDGSIRPDECSSGWTDGLLFEHVPLPEGMRAVACMWD
jgi:hypothetical protein